MKQKTITQPAHDRETVGRLLDTAERLFGEQGYDGVGIRELATEANVNLGAATYHFGSKKALYLETFMRRFRPTNAERLRLLRKAEAEAKSKPLTVEKIVDCMVRPPYLLGLEHPNFDALMARSLFMPPPFLHAAIHKELAPNVEVFIAAFRRSLPDVPEDLLHLRTMFAMGALLMFSVQRGKMRFPQNSKFDDSLLRELIRFISAGLQSEPAVVGSERPSIPLPPRPPRR